MDLKWFTNVIIRGNYITDVVMELTEELRNEGYEIATFAARSFWISEAIFRKVQGVVATAVGYIGGKLDYPTYEEVSEGDTGHVEVVQIVYDPKVVPYEKLLELFWELHNPTFPDEKGKKYHVSMVQSFSIITMSRSPCNTFKKRGRDIQEIREGYNHRDTSCCKIFQGKGIPPAIFRKNGF